jgi:polyribonucleotide nucleotidyltransferase
VALDQAKEARIWVLEKMTAAIPTPRSEMSRFAPRIRMLQVNPEKIKDLIGPGGKMIRSIIAETNVKIDVEDSGKVLVASSDFEMMEKAIAKIQAVCAEPEVGKIYQGKVRRIVDFGAFVEILPGTDGLLHISQIDVKRVGSVNDYFKEGDTVEVKVIAVDSDNKIRLSRKVLLPGGELSEEEIANPPRRSSREGGNDRRPHRRRH